MNEREPASAIVAAPPPERGGEIRSGERAGDEGNGWTRAGGDSGGPPSAEDAADEWHDEPEIVVAAGDEPERMPIPESIRTAGPEDLAPALEALCFALNRALTLSEAGAVLGRPPAFIGVAADVLSARLRDRGMMLQRHRDEIQLVTRPEVAWAVQRALNPEKPGRLSRPALETLAIVAYRQPATRAAIEGIRGVNCEAVLDSLERRGLVAEVGRADTPGHPRLFGTTLRFLQLVGLERIENLPPMPDELIAGGLGDDGCEQGEEEDAARETRELIGRGTVVNEAHEATGAVTIFGAAAHVAAETDEA